MMIMDALYKLIVLKSTNILYSGKLSSSLVLDHEPNTSGSYIKIRTLNSFLTDITFTLSDGTSSESLVFSKKDRRISTKKYKPTLNVNITGLEGNPDIYAEITAVDMSGNSEVWYTSYTYDVSFSHMPSYPIVLAKLKTEGLSSSPIVKIMIEWDADIKIGDKFFVENQLGEYIVWTEPEKRFQLGTDLIDRTIFYGRLISTTNNLIEITNPSLYDSNKIVYDKTTGKIYLYSET